MRRTSMVGYAAVVAFCVSAGVAGAPAQPPEPANLAAAGKRIAVWDIPDIDQLPDDEHGRLVRYGRSVLEATARHIGPDAPDPVMRFAGNNLACTSCHLDAGRKKFGLPLVAAAADYPLYSARSGELASLEDRLDSCMTRSMNGRPMPRDVRPMRALVAYLTVLSSALPRGAAIEGAGAGAMAELDRPADPARGAVIYARTCVFCHGEDGRGLVRNGADASLGYGVPPLWGPDSFNDGAGMNRLVTIANFVHDNMPAGIDWLMPALVPADAWDVAAYVASRGRPHREGLEKDFPDLLDKPVDAPYGPYADSFPQAQHKYGPFAPIRAEIARLKAEKGTVPNPDAR
ncbi:c-type cytochrome [Xanthobacter autotrophicus DSM 431]|uniref:c-type cytochrome n=1 Tax=Xanthobacter nonsaccharivorans TaxID=3119912 RepID=UPI003727A382